MVSSNLKLHQTSIPVIVVIGPTASGKTHLVHKICDRLSDCVPLNLDASQFYKGLDIGTAKPSLSERKQYGYKLLDFLNPWDRIDAQIYADAAQHEITKLTIQRKKPICVGGSGLYLRSLIDPLDPLPRSNDETRKFLRSAAEIWGWPMLHNWLSLWDPIRASALHPNDKARIERALEVFFLTGQSLTELQKSKSTASSQKKLKPFIIQIRPQLDDLRFKIAPRVKKMFEDGWVTEVKELYGTHGLDVLKWQSFQAIGYKEILMHFLNPSQSEDALMDLVTVQTCQYARRQLTWNRKVESQLTFNSVDLTEFEFDELLMTLKLWFSEA